MQWIIENISWIKDMLWVIFTLIATAIAILTYRRARYTLLQPLHSEVVKRQTELLMNLLEFLPGEKGEIDFAIDYEGILVYNAHKLLELCDYKLTDESIGENVHKNSGGFMLLKELEELKNFFVPYDSFNLDEKTILKRQADYRKHIKKQIVEDHVVELEVIYLTKKHSDTIAEFKKFRDNPLTPKIIQNCLSQFLDDIDYNIKVPLLSELSMFILNAATIASDKNSPIKFTYQALYNDFIRQRRSHAPIIKELTNNIRKYLLVDAKWS